MRLRHHERGKENWRRMRCENVLITSKPLYTPRPVPLLPSCGEQVRDDARN